MTTATEELGTFVRCYWDGGSTFTDFPYACWDRLRRCVTGEEQARFLVMNSVLDIDTVFRTDRVAMVYLSTPEARQRAYERDRLWKREADENDDPDWMP